MDRQLIESIISPKLSNFQLGEGNLNLLRAEYLYNTTKVGIYFIDYGETSIDYDTLDDYLEKNISSDYYNNPGPLQWNYYLIFVREANQIVESNKSRIERNDIYCRKFVFTVEELKNYFRYEKSNEAIETNAISNWKEKLRSVDLDEVYDTTPYTQSIERFLDANVKKDTSASEPISASIDIVNIGKILTLKLGTSYREHPIKRHFELGGVNLIEGVNGTGKTSLLEAIELIVTGKCNSNPNIHEENKSIGAIYNGQIKDYYTPSDNTKYRNRDANWYFSSYKQGNETYQSFNRYNFFNSDAAYHLSHDTDDIKNISKSLSALALGTEFGRIQDRLKGFKDRLQGELRSREKRISEETTRIADANRTINDIAQSADPKLLFEIYLNTIKDIEWKGGIQNTIDESGEGYEKDYQLSLNLINTINDSLEKLRLTNLRSLKAEATRILETTNSCSALQSQIEIIRKSIFDKREIAQLLDEEVKMLSEAEKYFSYPDSFKLISLDLQLKEVNFEINTYQGSLNVFAKLSNTDILNNDGSFQQFKQKQNDFYDELNANHRNINKDVNNLKSNLDKLQQLTTDLKYIGKEIITVNTLADSCPLCGTQYPYSELSERISKIDDAILENNAISILNEQLIKLNQEIIAQQVILNDTNLIEQIILILYPSKDYSAILLKEVKARLASIAALLDEARKRSIELGIISSTLQSLNFSETKFLEFKNQFERKFPEIPFVVESSNLYQDVLQKKSYQLNELQNEIDKQMKEGETLRNSIDEILSKLHSTLNYSNYAAELIYKGTQIENNIKNFEALQGLIYFKEDTDISEIKQANERLHIAYEEYKRMTRQQIEQQAARDIISKANDIIETLTSVVQRLKSALGIIEEILNSNNEIDVLSQFIKNNEQEIKNIFCSIHAPKEFDNVVFDYEKASILLHRTRNNEFISLSKISTGQRSALALSIFLALNKKLKNGPNVILFDDPVTYIDDLNTLSFLDYLREIVINENKQIFFATANKKLAGLLKKKFAFLGDEFKDFLLERNA